MDIDVLPQDHLRPPTRLFALLASFAANTPAGLAAKIASREFISECLERFIFWYVTGSNLTSTAK